MGDPPCPPSCPPSALLWPELDVFPWLLLDALALSVLLWSVLLWSMLPWSASPLARLGLLDNSSNMQRQSANRQVIAMVENKCKRNNKISKIKFKKNVSSNTGWLKCNGQPQTWFMSLICVQYVHISAPVSPLPFHTWLLLAGEAQPRSAHPCIPSHFVPRPARLTT